MIPDLIEIQDIDFEYHVVKERFGYYTIYRRDGSFVKNYYFRLPSFTGRGLFGPFLTQNGAEKYAQNIRYDLDYGCYG